MTNPKKFVKDYALTAYTFNGIPEDRFIAKLISTYMRGKRVLDLGCGPVLPITSLFYRDAEEVVGVDIFPENLDFIRDNSSDLSQIIDRAIRYRNRYIFERNTKPRVKLTLGDITEKLPLGKFDSVMQLGCFGCLDTDEQFQAAVDNAYTYLKPGGTLLMVTWLDDKPASKVDREYHFNGDVNAKDLYIPCLEKAGFKIQDMHKLSSILSEDSKKMGYKKVLWAACRK